MPPDKKVCEECREPWSPIPAGVDRQQRCKHCGNRTWDYETPVEVLLGDITPEEWKDLEVELAKLEHSDPAVRKAAENYHREVKKLARKRKREQGE